MISARSWNLIYFTGGVALVTLLGSQQIPRQFLRIKQRQIIEIGTSFARVSTKKVNVALEANALTAGSGCWFKLLGLRIARITNYEFPFLIFYKIMK